MTKTNRVRAMLMVILMMFMVLSSGAVLKVGAVSKPGWFTVNSVTNIKPTDAKISARIKNPNKTAITRVGFKIGTTSNKLSTNKYDSILNKKWNYVDASFLMSKYKVTLKANTKYYYQFYIVTGGKSYEGPVCNFKTKSNAPTISLSSVTGLKYNNATINGTMSNPYKLKIEKYGFQFGTSSSKLSTKATKNLNSTVASKSLNFTMKSYNVAIKGGTKYYYRFFVTSGGKTYYSAVKNFTTPPQNSATKICFPLSTNQVWSASTYVGHGGSNASAYSSVDIILKNGKSAKGYAVYAVEDGTVVSDDAYLKSIGLSANGQIIIKHKKTLITTNGKKYTTWYSMYAHMSNITVKTGSVVKCGQQIGKVSDVGNATGPHLHFTISSGLNGTSWYQTSNKDKAISPYYVYGFVNSNGSNTSYCVCDRKGTGVTNQLINWKPTGK